MKHHLKAITDHDIQIIAVVLALLALLVRLVLIARFSHGGDDLQIYRYFGDLILKGLNPYQAPLDGSIRPSYADMPPFNLGVFAAVLSFNNSPLTLRLFFAIIDFVIVLTIGLWASRSKSWRIARMLFYGFNPLMLTTLVVVSEDKVVILLMLIMVFIFIESRNAIGAVLTTTALTIYKWMGVFFFAPLAFYFAKRRRDLLLYGALFVAIIAISHLPFFPDNLLAYKYREARTLIQPIHASITTFLALAGIYHPVFVRAVIAITVVTTYTLFFLHKIGLKELIVLSIFFTYIGAPEIGADRIVLITMPFMFIVELSRARQAAIWIVTTVAAVAIFVEFLDLPVDPTVASVLFGKGASLQHVILMNLFPALMVFYYLKDKLTGKVASDDTLPYPLVRFLRARAA